MIAVMLILIAATVGFGLATWQKLPHAPILLVLGIALNALGMLEQGPMVQSTMLLGLTFLVFVVGAELLKLKTLSRFE